MSRRLRFALPSVVYHVVNRGNDRRLLFVDQEGYRRFRWLLTEGTERYPMKVHGYCLMPNHFHLLLEPEIHGALSAYMQWVSCRYADYFRITTKTRGHGHVFQRRFWSAPIEHGYDAVCVLRYIEANPVRGGLTTCASEWPWGSLIEREVSGGDLFPDFPVPLPSRWRELVNSPLEPVVLDEIRRAITPPPGRPKRSARFVTPVDKPATAVACPDGDGMDMPIVAVAP